MFGGNGYSREFPRRARLPRRAHHAHLRGHQRDQPPASFPTRLLKQRRRRSRRGARRSMSGGQPASPLAAERELRRRRPSGCRHCRCSAAAADAYGDRLKDEQEVLAHDRRHRHRDLRGRERDRARGKAGSAPAATVRRWRRIAHASTPAMPPIASSHAGEQIVARPRRARRRRGRSRASTPWRRIRAPTPSRRAAESGTRRAKPGAIRSEVLVPRLAAAAPRAAASPAGPRATLTAPGAAYALAVLFAINLMNFFDRQILGGGGRRDPSRMGAQRHRAGRARHRLHAALRVRRRSRFGRLADRAVRKHILAAGVLAWSLLTAASGLARIFWQLFVVRLGVGVGEATCSPASTSLIGDLYRTDQRARATAIFMLGLPIGLGLSFLIGGLVAAATGAGGRRSFSPPRRACWARWPRCSSASRARGMVDEHRGRRTPARRLAVSPGAVHSRPCWWIILSGALHNFNMYALGAFLAPS